MMYDLKCVFSVIFAVPNICLPSMLNMLAGPGQCVTDHFRLFGVKTSFHISITRQTLIIKPDLRLTANRLLDFT